MWLKNYCRVHMSCLQCYVGSFLWASWQEGSWLGCTPDICTLSLSISKLSQAHLRCMLHILSLCTALTRLVACYSQAFLALLTESQFICS